MRCDAVREGGGGVLCVEFGLYGGDEGKERQRGAGSIISKEHRGGGEKKSGKWGAWNALTASLVCIRREEGANASADEAQNAAAMARLRSIIIIIYILCM